MPIPVHAATYLAQVVFPFVADINNASTNTFFFGDGIDPPRDPDVVADAIEAVMNQFYSLSYGGGANALEVYMSKYLDGANASVKVYDLSEPAPRIPLVRSFTITPGSSDLLPNEVAVVLSYRSGPGTPGKGGTNDPTKRGRLFIGPLNEAARAGYSSAQPDTPVSTDLRDVLRGSAELLANNTEDLVWLQYSRKEDALGIVSGGFVENAFDTQRRRGARATARTLWDA